MKFENIKEGDTVYISKNVRHGFSSAGDFWIPFKVSRVTPKQFIAGKNRYNKKDGGCIGGSYGDGAFNIGDVSYRQEVKDQTDEMNDFIVRVNKSNYIYRSLRSGVSVDCNHPNLNDIHGLVKELIGLIARPESEDK